MLTAEALNKLSHSILDDLRMFVRVSTGAYDTEILMLAESAIMDMERIGVRESYIVEMNPRVRNAIACYVKANFGYDNEEADRFSQSYRQLVIDMLHSHANIAEKLLDEDDQDE